MSRLVLIVDDDEALAENVAEIVGTLDVETKVARDRQSALTLAGEHDFDVALIDVRLPDGDGMSLLEPLRALSPFTQLVMVTGNATIEGAIAAVRGDAFAYVLKPVSPPDLLDTVRRALEQAGLYRERERFASSWSAPRGATASWWSSCRRSCWPSTPGARSPPGTSNWNRSRAFRARRCWGRRGTASWAPTSGRGISRSNRGERARCGGTEPR